LLEHFGTAEGVFTARESEYRDTPGLRLTDITALMNKNTVEAEKILKSCGNAGCRIITLFDGEYPERLRNIYDPPILMYIKGELPAIDDEPVVAVVGTRNCTAYGRNAAEKTGYELARCGITVATGLARGVDTSAALGALAGGGRIIGVIGSGIDVVYPHENTTLFDEVARKGAIITEYPPGTLPLPWNFPARNRIISGISLGVAVIEAPKRSGALVTASRAVEQGRDVFSLPGNVDAKNCEGSNALLREGAIPFMSAGDIISEYSELFPDKIIGIEDIQEKNCDGSVKEPGGDHTANYGASSGKRRNMKSVSGKKEIDNESEEDYIDLDKILGALDGDERAVAVTIGYGRLLTDDIIVGSDLSAARVLSALTMLEVSGRADRDENGKWKIRGAD